MALFDRETIGFFRHFLRAYPARSAVMVALLSLAGVMEGMGVMTMLPLLELVSGDGGREPSGISQAVAGGLDRVGLQPTLGVLLSVIVAAMTAKGLLIWVAMRQVGYTVAQVTTDSRMRLLRSLMKVRWGYYASQSIGEFTAAVSSEAQRASAAYREGCVIIAGILQIAVYVAVAMMVSWQIALLTLVIGAVFLFLLRRLVQIAREAGRQQTLLMRSLIRKLTDALQGMKPIRAMARESHLQQLLERDTEGLNRTLRRQVMASETLRLFQEPVLVLLLAVGLFIALGMAGLPFELVLIMAFIFYRIMTHTNNLQSRYQTLTKGESAFWSMWTQLQTARREEEVITGTQPPPPLTEAVELDGVHFRYEEHAPVLSGLTIRIPARSMTALYGASGAGKTTIADLVLGLFHPDEGQVRIDGMPLEEMDLLAWRRQVGYVPQEVFLFHDTIFNNVTLGDESLTQTDVEAALRAADAWEFVASRTDGMDEVIGEGGSMLSGGQRQRISIARALVHRPRLLILDEATAALDPATELEVLATLQGLREEVTILAISHQPALRDAADVVYFLEKGEVTEVDESAGGTNPVPVTSNVSGRR